MDQRFYTAMSTDELASELSGRVDRLPIDMDFVKASVEALARLLSNGTTSDGPRSASIGYLMLLDAMSLDMGSRQAPRAEDGDIIFAHHSWAPGARFEELLRSLVIAAKAAQLQRADAMERAGLSDLATRDHRRDTRDELETQTENEALS